MSELFTNIFSDYTLRTVTFGSAVLGITSGALGCFAVLRKQSLVGDIVAHSSLPGIALAFFLAYVFTGEGSKSFLLLLSGALVTGLLAMLAAGSITRNTRVKQDSAMGIILAVFFGTGVFILNLIQRSTIRNKSGLDDYIFGSAATMTQEDVISMAILGGLALIIMSVFWKELKAHTFDSNFSDTIGISYSVMNPLLLGLIVVSIVIGLQAVGVILMVSMIIAPAASARQWTDNLVIMVLLAALFGAFAGITGAIVSGNYSRIPTGPVVILTITSIFLLSLLFAPKRGLLTAFLKRLNYRRQIMLSLVLTNLYLLKVNHNYKRDAGHSAKVISMMQERNFNAEKSLKVLRTLGFVTNDSRGNWILTGKGVEKAKGVIENRGEMV